jgi:hypothetical protein
MTDDELKKLLRNSLAGRRAPDSARARVFAALGGRRPVRSLGLLAFAAAAIACAVGVKFVVRAKSADLPPAVAEAMGRHREPPPAMHGAQALQRREISEKIQQQSGLSVELPILRDAGFDALEAHTCDGFGAQHVIYANSFSKLSCFILEASRVDLSRARRVEEDGVEAYLFGRDDVSVVAVREGGLVKLWVSDLRAKHLSDIAIDVERKRNKVKTLVLGGVKDAAAKAAEQVFRAIPGVQDVRVETGKARVQFDPDRVTELEIGAVAVETGVADWPTPAGGDSR